MSEVCGLRCYGSGHGVGGTLVAKHISVHYGHYHTMFPHAIQGEFYDGKWGRVARKQRRGRGEASEHGIGGKRRRWEKRYGVYWGR